MGKSTLSKFLAAKLGWSYIATDSLARHPGRPWANANGTVKDHVAEHYRTLSIESLLNDVLSHYRINVLPQVKVLVDSHTSDLSTECLIIEGSALYPSFIADLVNKNSVRAIWLIGSDRTIQTRIFRESNFYNVDKDKHYLIQKFLDRTLLYNSRMQEEVKRLGFSSINVDSLTVNRLANHCLKLMNLLIHYRSQQFLLVFEIKYSKLLLLVLNSLIT